MATDDNNDLPKHELLIKMMGMTQSDNDNQALVAIRKANEVLKAAGWDWERVLRGKIKVVENPFAGKNPFESLRTQKTPDPDDGFVMSPRPKRTASARPPKPTTNPGVGMMWEFNHTTWSWVAVFDPHYVPPSRRPPKPTNHPGQGRVWMWDDSVDMWVTTHDPSYTTTPRPALVASTRNNLYSGHCWCCGDYVDNDAGWIFKPVDFNNRATPPSKSGWATICDPCNKEPSPNIGSRPAPRNTGQTTRTVNVNDL